MPCRSSRHTATCAVALTGWHAVATTERANRCCFCWEGASVPKCTLPVTRPPVRHCCVDSQTVRPCRTGAPNTSGRAEECLNSSIVLVLPPEQAAVWPLLLVPCRNLFFPTAESSATRQLSPKELGKQRLSMILVADRWGRVRRGPCSRHWVPNDACTTPGRSSIAGFRLRL